jgi:hypothetical protein
MDSTSADREYAGEASYTARKIQDQSERNGTGK